MPDHMTPKGLHATPPPPVDYFDEVLGRAGLEERDFVGIIVGPRAKRILKAVRYNLMVMIDAGDHTEELRDSYAILGKVLGL